MAIAAATEAAELAVDVLRASSLIGTARRRLVGMIDAHGAALARPLQAVAAEHEARSWGSISRWLPTRSTSGPSGRRSRPSAPAPSAARQRRGGGLPGGLPGSG